MNAAADVNSKRADSEIFAVSGAMNFFSWLICEHPRAWSALGRMETSLLADRLDDVTVQQPVWVTGLARSGSTLLLEILAGVPGVVSQSYKDFPPVFTPYAWNRLLGYMGGGTTAPAERAHQDGIMVTQDSPEAMEEPLWMAHFPHAHDPATSNVIAPGANPEFAEFLRNHIRKLLSVRNGQRYLAKANYQITRLEFLLEVFPDARFVIPVRAPHTHIASLMKTHALFVRGQRANARARRHLRRVGHYEFGLDRQPINTGDSAATATVLELWQRGEEVRGWAHYWAQIYGYVADRLAQNPRLAAAARLVVFEDLCARPEAELAAIMEHCGLSAAAGDLTATAARIKQPSYYQANFSAADAAAISDITAAVAARVGTTAAPA